MFKRLEVTGSLLGYFWETERYFFFFGTRELSREKLMAHFASYHFSFIKQVHGTVTVNADTTQVCEADAQFTTQSNLALVVQSADCLPILLAGPGGICAIHAGWRGVAANIVAAAGQAAPNLAPEHAIIGPHIGYSSFEIDADVRDQLQTCCPGGDKMWLSREGEKFRFDLTAAACAQIRLAFPTAAIADLAIDTTKSAEFHSFRRERERAGRQYSFVVLKA